MHFDVMAFLATVVRSGVLYLQNMFLPVRELRVGSERAGAGWVLWAAIDSI